MVQALDSFKPLETTLRSDLLLRHKEEYGFKTMMPHEEDITENVGATLSKLIKNSLRSIKTIKYALSKLIKDHDIINN